MQKVNIEKEDLEFFIKSFIKPFIKPSDRTLFKDTYKLNGKTIANISSLEFKEIFFNNILDFTNNGHNLEIYNILYKKIASDNNKFYSKIRGFIIETFTKSIKNCPYCGKTSLIYFDKIENKDNFNSKRRLFQFDHFFPKNSYHKGIINFYNLVPSCNACNHLKGDNNPIEILNNGKEIFHPYFGRIYKKGNIIETKDETFDNEVSFTKKKKLIFKTEHSKFFKLAQIYLNSQDTFDDFDFMYDKYTKIKDEKMRFKNNTKDDKDMINYFFKNYYPENEKDILKYSNGKFKKDVIGNMTFNL